MVVPLRNVASVCTAGTSPNLEDQIPKGNVVLTGIAKNSKVHYISYKEVHNFCTFYSYARHNDDRTEAAIKSY